MIASAIAVSAGGESEGGESEEGASGAGTRVETSEDEEETPVTGALEGDA